MAQGAANLPEVGFMGIGRLLFGCLSQLLVAAVAAQAGFHGNPLFFGFVAMAVIAADSLL